MDKKKTYTNMVNIGYTVIVLAIIYYLCNQLSDLLSRWIVIPGNIIGIGALFLLLELKIVKFERIKKTSEFLLSHLGLFFIPFVVSILKHYSLIAASVVEIVIILIVSTILALVASSYALEKVGD